MECPACKSKQPSIEMLQEHMKICEKNVQMIVCKQCGVEYNYNNERKHMLMCEKGEVKRTRSRSVKATRDDTKTSKKKSSSQKTTRGKKEVKKEYPDELDPVTRAQRLNQIKKDTEYFVPYGMNVCRYQYENYSYIEPSDWKNLFKDGEKSLVSLMKLLHCNDEHPENHCMKIKKNGSKFVYIHNNGEWLKRDCKQILKDYILQKTGRLEKEYQAYIRKGNKPIREFALFMTNINDMDNETYHDSLYKKLYKCLVNFRPNL